MSRASRNWTNTYSGTQFWPMDPRVEDININDIARGLSNQGRFSGQTKFHYSVAQHSVLCARKAPQHLKLKTLLHDAEEAYFVDVPRPIKREPFMADYCHAADVCREVIFVRYKLTPGMEDEIKDIDNRMVITEALQLIPNRHPDWLVDWPFVPYDDVTIERWSNAKARREFLSMFNELCQLQLDFEGVA